MKIPLWNSRALAVNTARHWTRVVTSTYRIHKYGLTLSLVFTSNPQNLTRYSTMDDWPSWAAQCKAVYPESSGSKRWPFILGARYLATARWPLSAHTWKALHPSYMEQEEQAHNWSPPVHTCMREAKEIDNSTRDVIHVVHVTTEYIIYALLQNTSTHWIEWHGISHTTESHTMNVTYNWLKHE